MTGEANNYVMKSYYIRACICFYCVCLHELLFCLSFIYKQHFIESKFSRPEQGAPTPSAISNIFELIKFNFSLEEETTLKFMKRYEELYDMEDPLYEERKVLLEKT